MVEYGLEPERLARVTLALGGASVDPTRLLCAAAADVIGVHSAGVVLMSRGQVAGRFCAPDDGIAGIEDLEYTLGQGPCVDAFWTAMPVMAANLAAVDGGLRWPEFSHGALAVGMRAAFGFPLRVGSVCIGALNLYERDMGALSGEQFADAIAVAQVTARTVLTWQADATPGELAWQLEAVPSHLAVVHRATGRVSVQAGVAVDDALVMLRAHAFAEDRPIVQVAQEIEDGRLRLA